MTARDSSTSPSGEPPAAPADGEPSVSPGGWTDIAIASRSLSHAVSGASDDFGFGVGPPAEIPPGTDLGGVTIVRLIGSGGMGRVYEARQWAPERTVAVKVMRDGIVSTGQLRRFDYEAQVLARLRHPHIAQIHMLGTARLGPLTVPFFVMELVPDARSLTQFCDEAVRSVRARVELMRRVCAAVAHGHQKGIIHRDIKPGNILVDPAGEPKVIDFGVARSTAGDAAAPAPLTEAGQILGTLCYMSPEQFAGTADDVDARTDVHALGLVLHEVVVGRLPYEIRGRSVAEVARVIAEHEPRVAAVVQVAARRDPTITADDARSLGVIVSKCLEKRPDDRYPTAAEVEAELGRWLAGEPILARPLSTRAILSRLARRHRAATAAGAAMVASLVAAVVGISIFAARAEWQAAEARAQLYRATVLLAGEARDRDAVAEARRLLATARGLCGDAGSNHPIELDCLAASLDQSIAVRVGHAGTVKSVAWSPDGRRLATASDDGTVRLWDRPEPGAANESPTRVIVAGDGEELWAVAWSPDGSRLATGSADGAVRMHDASDGTERLLLKGHRGIVYGVAFSPDGKRLASASRDGTVRLWNARSGAAEQTLEGHTGTVYSVCFAPDGSRLATAGKDQSARLWDAATGEPLAVLTGHGGRVFFVTFSPQGDRLMTASEDATVRIWDVPRSREHAVLVHPFKANAAAFTAAGSRVVTASDDGVLRVWDVEQGHEIARRRGHERAIWSVAAAADGKWVATGSADATVRIWDAAGSSEPVLGCDENVLAAAHDPDGGLIAIGTAGAAVALWNARTLRPIGRCVDPCGRVNDVRFFPDGSRLAAACDDGGVRLWELPTRTVSAASAPDVIRAHTRRVYAVDVDSAGGRLATAGEDRAARVWDLADVAKPLATCKHGRRVLCVRFSPDGRQLFTACEDRVARLWDIDRPTERRRYEGHTGPVNWLAVSPDGRRLATASSDTTVRLWDVASSTAAATLTGPARQVWKVAFTPDGSRVVGVSADGVAHVWDARSGQPTASLRGHGDEVWGLAIAPDGRSLVTGSSDGTARVWGLCAAEVFGERADGPSIGVLSP